MIKVKVLSHFPCITHIVPEITTTNLSSIDEFVSSFVRDNVITINDYTLPITDVMKCDDMTLVFNAENPDIACGDIACALHTIASLTNISIQLT